GAPCAGHGPLETRSTPGRKDGLTHRGLTFFRHEDLALTPSLARGALLIHGFGNKTLRALLGWKAGQVSRALRRLRFHGLIRKIGRTYRYHLTAFGRLTLIAGLHLRRFVLLPALNQLPDRFAKNPA